MKFISTSIDTHIDYGFGVTAQAFLDAAKHLDANDDFKLSVTSQGMMPVHYLYRHSIELFLKSLIIILHKTLRLPFDNFPHDSKPKIMYKTKVDKWEWKDMDQCHFISSLFDYWSLIIVEHRDHLEKVTNYKWDIDPTAPNKAKLISSYDDSSTYFRYPVDRDMQFDPKKHSVKRISTAELFNPSNSLEGKSTFVQMLGENIVANIYQEDKNDNDLEPVLVASKELAEYLSGMHIMSRIELCQGY